MKRLMLRTLVLLIPLLFIAAVLLGMHLLGSLSAFIDVCPSRKYFDLLCPACGNTRAVISLLHGDLLSSLAYNATPTVLLIIGITFYVELVARAFNKRLVIFPRSLAFTCSLLGAMMLYYVLRNFIPF